MDDNVVHVDFKTIKSSDNNVMEGKARCPVCGNVWKVVVESPNEIECPKCFACKGYLLHSIDTGEKELWHCSCGSYLFYAMKDGLKCPSCGEWQVGVWDEE